MTHVPNPAPMARVIPIHHPSRSGWQGDLLGYLGSNPRHLAWLIDRPVIRHFVDEVLIAQMIHDRAEEVAIYHSPWRFEIDFRLEGRRHRVQVPNHRWAMPILLRLRQRAGMDLSNAVSWQVGEFPLGDESVVNVWFYPNARSERLVLRPRNVRLRGVA